MPPPIPPILDEELLEAVSALASAARSYRSVLFLAAEAEPKVRDLMMKHEDLLNLSDSIINAWCEQLGLDGGDAEDGST
jgi:hypothetical protein